MNGYLCKQIKLNDSFDETTGTVIVGQITWDKDVECKYVNSKSIYTYPDGKFTKATYDITVEDMSFTAEIVRLKNSNRVVVCEKEVQSLDILEGVQRVKITI